jgi:hypothetical protein
LNNPKSWSWNEAFADLIIQKACQPKVSELSQESAQNEKEFAS